VPASRTIHLDGGSSSQVSSKRYKEITSVCERCPSPCCFRFSMYPMRRANKTIAWDAWRDAKDKDWCYAVEFVKKNMTQCRYPAHMGCRSWLGALNQPMVFTCKCWDKKTGLCSKYRKRPMFCKIFICQPALDGVVPGRVNFGSQYAMMIR